MVAALQQPSSPPAGPSEQRILLQDVAWETYVALNDAPGSKGVRMAYFRGALELMSPSNLHEDYKKTIARLLEFWATERDLPLHGYGNTTFRDRFKKAGAEPDECYARGRKLAEAADRPDIALEVVLTSGGMDKLAVYAALGVREVWFWQDRAFHLYALRGDRYEPIAQSAIVPEIDLAVIAELTLSGDQHEAVKALRERLRGAP